ncbi:MAG: DNA polymerase ligase N-terminal domain-containing protein [Ilumatobacteraceae bacterium]
MTSRSDRLAEYDSMRTSDETPEPPGRAVEVGEHGAVAINGRRRFVVQRHRARRLHFDVRLEHAGVLLSWAVPKGPSLDPKARRLAVRTEDHPFAYRWFEGVIESGYGKGDVIMWDDGWWEPDPDEPVDDALAAGKLKFTLHGGKVAGGYVLIATDGDQWLLTKRSDDDAVRGWTMEDPPRSRLTSRTNDEVVAGEPPWWDPPTDRELAALDDLPGGGDWEVGGRVVALTNLDKELLPARGPDSPAVTKRDLVRYVTTMAPAFAPALVARPVNLTRYPDGPGGESFWQKAVPAHAPEWLRRWPDPGARRGRTREYLVVDGAPALAWVANAAAIEIHPWTSTAMSPDEPSYALVDIDPGTATSWDDTLLLVRQFRAALDHLGLVARAKVTGKRGIQIWIPVRRGLTFADTRGFVERLSRAVDASVPDLVSWRWNTDEREGRARLDYTQNAANRTLVAPYSPRPAPGGPVSVPIEWDELDDPDLRPDRWTIGLLPDRLAIVGDPFRALVGVEQDLPVL